MRTYKRGNSWAIDYCFKGKRYRKKIGSSKKIADLTLMDIQVRIAKNEHLGVHETIKILFEDFAKQYLEYAKTNKSANTYRLNITNFRALTPFFQGKCLSEILSQDIERYKAQRITRVSPASVNRDLSCLRHALRKSCEWGYLISSPMRGVTFFKEPPGRLRFLSEEEINRLLDELPKGSRTIVLCALYTGLRKGELLGLTWNAVDLKNRMIRVEKTKTNERRIIPISEGLFKHLLEMSHKNKNGKDFIFSTYKKNLRRNFEAGLKRAGIEDFRFHDLRHTFASHLVMNAVGLKVVQELLGHKTMAMTMRYSHLSQDHLQDAINRLTYIPKEGTNQAPTKDPVFFLAS